MELIDIFQRFAVALGIGLLLGIERGWRKREKPEGSKPAGVRTITLYALTGGLGGLLGVHLGDGIVVAIALAAAAFIVTGYVLETRAPDSDKGFTTELASFVAFGLGLLAMRGEMIAAAALGVVVAAILDLKRETRLLLERLEEIELTSAIKLLIASVLLLPVLPNQGFGPGGVLNPYELWWIVVMVSAISFIGYAAIRILGPSIGARWMGVFGGLTSSTAVTVSAARIARRTPALVRPMAGAMALAQSVMFVRVGLVAAALAPPLLPPLLPALAAGSLTAAIAGLAIGRAAREHDGITLDEPVDFRTAVLFAALIAAVLVGAHFGNAWFGEAGLYAVAALSGLVDVDAVTATAARLSSAGEITVAVGAQALAVAVAVNSLVKAAIAAFIGGRDMAWLAAVGFAGSAAASLAAAFAAGAL